MSKTIGTFVPLSSLISEATNTYGVIENGFPFIDWLVKTKQSAWQMLPLHETQLIPGSTTEHAPSPYKGYGVGIDPKYLSEKAKKQTPTYEQLAQFMEEQASWITDYALFCSLRDAYGTDDWRDWSEPLAKRNPATIARAQQAFEKPMKKYILEQWQLHTAFAALKKYASTQQVQLIGDIPFYLSVQSPLVWTHQDCFVMDYLHMPRVSGVPNRKNAIFGRQVWGHPLYAWDRPHVRDHILHLWKQRISYTTQLFHTLRFDHANGFFLYGAIDPFNEAHDELIDGPGEEVLKELIMYTRSLGVFVYVEDTAKDLTKLRAAMETLKLQGVRILRFAYNEEHNLFENDYVKPSQYPEDCVAYTTTHDTEPLMLFLSHLTLEQKRLFGQEVGATYHDDDSFVFALREAVLTSPAHIVILPIQDWLLTTQRINTPGTEDPVHDTNWQYRVKTPIEKLSILRQ